jgi:DNA-binding response OmpR family regulator
VRVLVVEDEVPLADAVAAACARGHGRRHAYDGDSGLEKAMVTRYDVLVLDRDLPGGPATTSAGDWPGGLAHPGAHAHRRRDARGPRRRASSWAPTTTSASRSPSASSSRACGRSAVAPPRRAAGAARPDGIVVDPARRTATRHGTDLGLTRKELGVLEELLRAEGAVVSSEELLERVWDEFADPFTTTVRVTVMTLRKKLGEPRVVHTVVGAGYRLGEP